MPEVNPGRPGADRGNGRRGGGDHENRRPRTDRANGSGLDAGTAERMVDGAPVGPPALVRLLAAASAAPPPGVPSGRGEEEAVAAFRVAVAARAATGRDTVARATTGWDTVTRASSGRRGVAPAPSAWARALTIKIVGVVLSITVAGVAVAAGTGVLPNPLHPAGPEPTTSTPAARRTPAPGAPGQPGPLGSAPAAGRPSGAAPGTSPSGATASASPPAARNLASLCRQYQSNPTAARRSPRYPDLVAAAGGEDRVDAYCTNLVGPPGGGKGHSSPSPGPSAAPAATGAGGGHGG